MSGENLIQTLLLGGWTIYPLLLCSLIALAIIIERSLFGPLRKNVIPEKLLEELNKLLEKRSFDQMLGLCQGKNIALARIASTALANRGKPRDQLVRAVEVRGRKESVALLRYVNTLGIIAAVTPLIGLLGTVSGIMKTFAVIRTEGLGNAEAMAGGISEALVCTAAGLAIAIPSLVAYRFLQNQAKKLSVELEEMALSIVDGILEK